MKNLDEIIKLAKTRGPWHVDKSCNERFQLIRNDKQECPIHAAAIAEGHENVHGAFTGGEAMGIPTHDVNDIVTAADCDTFRDADLRSIREQLISGLEVT